MKKVALNAIVVASVKAVFDYLKSPAARRWEIALLAGAGDAVYQAVKGLL